MIFIYRFFLAIGFGLLLGCDADSQAARGFSLPKGDPGAGKLVYTQLQCNNCHSLPSVPQDSERIAGSPSVTLGGEVSSVQTYGQLVSSIINPSHRIAKGYPLAEVTENGQSRMRNYNEVMTVKELIDLVSYLQPQYQLRAYEHSRYRMYYP